MIPRLERTQKIEVLLGTVGTILIVVALFIYILNERIRIDASQAEILATQLNDAMTLYAENCSVCHGIAGEGISSIPALDNDGLRSMTPGDFTRIIAEGRYNTAMPAWSQSNGGSLSDYQVSELVALVQFGNWQTTQDRVVNLGLAPLVPFTTDPDPALLEAVALLPDGATLQAAITIYAGKCVACHGADGLGSSIAPALNDVLVREKTVDELTRIITYGNSGTLMAGWDGILLSDEIASMVSLIQRWDEVPVGVIPAPDVPVPVTAESLALGANLYSSNCTRCHGPEGQGTQRAPALNIQSFLTTVPDPAIQQIITLGIPGTSMPVWGDRMTDSEIQAIVGFIRQWEPTAPEVAVPVRIGGGGPPWMSNNTTTTNVPTVNPNATPQAGNNSGSQGTGVATHQPGSDAGGGQGGPPWQQTASTQTTSWWQILDWRILALITGALAISITLILLGYTSLKRPTRDREE